MFWDLLDNFRHQLTVTKDAVASYNALYEILTSHHQQHSSIHDYTTTDSIPLSQNQQQSHEKGLMRRDFTALLNLCQEQLNAFPNPLSVISDLGTMMESHQIMGLREYVLYLEVLCKNEKVASALTKLEEMHSKGFWPLSPLYQVILEHYAQNNEWEQCLSLYDTMQSRKVDIELGAAHIVLEAIGKLVFQRTIDIGDTWSGRQDVMRKDTTLRKLLERADVVWEHCKYSRGKLTTATTFELYISILSQALMPEKANLVLSELISEGEVTPTRNMYIPIIVGFCKTGDLENAGKLVVDFKSKDFAMTGSVYGPLIEGFARSGNLNTAMDYYRDCISSDIKIHIRTYNVLIAGYAVLGDEEMMRRLLQDLKKQHNMVPDLVLHNFVIHYALSKDAVDVAWKWFDKLSGSKVSAPDYYTFRTIFDYAAKSDKSNAISSGQLFDLFMDMKARKSIVMDEHMYMSVLNAFSIRNDLAFFKRVLRDVDSKLLQQKDMILTVAMGFARCGDISGTRNWLRQSLHLSRDAKISELGSREVFILMLALSRAHEEAKVVETFDAWLNTRNPDAKDDPPTSGMFGLFMENWLQVDNLGKLKSVFSKLEKSGYSFDISTWKSVFIGYLNGKGLEGLDSFFSLVPRGLIHIDETSSKLPLATVVNVLLSKTNYELERVKEFAMILRNHPSFLVNAIIDVEDVRGYNRLLKAIVSTGDMQQSLDFYKVLQSYNSVDGSTFNIMINGYLVAGHIQHVLEMYAEAQRIGVELSSALKIRLGNKLAYIGHPEMSREILSELKRDANAGDLPLGKVYEGLILGHCLRQSSPELIDEAFTFLRELVTLDSSGDSLFTILKSILSQKNTDLDMRVQTFVRDLVESNLGKDKIPLAVVTYAAARVVIRSDFTGSRSILSSLYKTHNTSAAALESNSATSPFMALVTTRAHQAEQKSDRHSKLLQTILEKMSAGIVPKTDVIDALKLMFGASWSRERMDKFALDPSSSFSRLVSETAGVQHANAPFRTLWLKVVWDCIAMELHFVPSVIRGLSHHNVIESVVQDKPVFIKKMWSSYVTKQMEYLSANELGEMCKSIEADPSSEFVEGELFGVTISRALESQRIPVAKSLISSAPRLPKFLLFQFRKTFANLLRQRDITAVQYLEAWYWYSTVKQFGEEPLPRDIHLFGSRLIRFGNEEIVKTLWSDVKHITESTQNAPWPQKEFIYAILLHAATKNKLADIAFEALQSLGRHVETIGVENWAGIDRNIIHDTIVLLARQDRDDMPERILSLFDIAQKIGIDLQDLTFRYTMRIFESRRLLQQESIRDVLNHIVRHCRDKLAEKGANERKKVFWLETLTEAYLKLGQLVKAHKTLEDYEKAGVDSSSLSSSQPRRPFSEDIWNELLVAYSLQKMEMDKLEIKSFGRILRKLALLNKFDVAYEWLVKFAAKNQLPGLKQLYFVIESSAIQEPGMTPLFVEFVEAHFDDFHLDSVYAPLLKLMKANRDYQGIVNVIQRVQTSHPKIGKHLNNQLIGAYLKLGDFKQAMNIFTRLSKGDVEGIRPDSQTFGIMFSHCGSDLKLLRTLKKEMTEQGVGMNTVVASSIFQAYSRAIQDFKHYSQSNSNGDIMGMVTEVEEFIQSGLKGELGNLDTMFWNSAMNVFLKLGDLDRVLSIFRDMRRQGISPDAFSYRVVLESYGHIGDFDGMNVWLSKIRRELGKLYEPDYLIVLNAACERKQFEYFEKWFHESQRIDNIEFSLFGWNLLLKSKYVQRDLRGMEQLWNEMKRERIRPDMYTYYTLLGAFASKGDLGKMEIVLEDLVGSKAFLTVDVWHHVIMALSVVRDKDGLVLIMKELFNAMDGNSSNSAKSNHRLIDLLTTRPTKIHHRIKPMTFYLLAQGFSNTGATQYILDDLFTGITQRGYTLDTQLLNILLESFMKTKDYSEALKVYENLRIQYPTIQPDIVTQSTLMKLYSRLGFTSECIRLFWNWKHKSGKWISCPPPKPTKWVTKTLRDQQIMISIVLDACGYGNTIHHADKIWKQLELERFRLDENVYNSFIEAQRRVGNIGRAVELITTGMKAARLRPSRKSLESLFGNVGERRFRVLEGCEGDLAFGDAWERVVRFWGKDVVENSID